MKEVTLYTVPLMLFGIAGFVMCFFEQTRTVGTKVLYWFRWGLIYLAIVSALGFVAVFLHQNRPLLRGEWRVDFEASLNFGVLSIACWLIAFGARIAFDKFSGAGERP